MTSYEKLGILADAAKYDVSCSSSGSDRKAVKGALGNTAVAGICHSWSDDGRCISLLKILYSNDCVYDCAYCVNRRSADIPRASFTPAELVELTIGFYRRNYIEGLFMSSAVMETPDRTMEQMISVVKRLRTEERFNGYIHMKGIPGADTRLLDEAGQYVDRMSLNLELPSDKGLRLLAPQKNQKSILLPMEHIKQQIIETREAGRKFRGAPSYVPAGQTTQLMVGATRDSDYSIIRVSEAMYRGLELKRVYYSAYVPMVQDNPLLPTIMKAPLLREHRLYQADWLMRFYKFDAEELLTREAPNFDPEVDPKANWALKNIAQFPVEVNRADYEMLLRVPGIGIVTARRIVSSRRFGRLGYEELKKLGVVLKRAKYFLLCNGRYYGEGDGNPALIRSRLVSADPDAKRLNPAQLSLFEIYPELEQQKMMTLEPPNTPPPPKRILLGLEEKRPQGSSGDFGAFGGYSLEGASHDNLPLRRHL